MSFPRKQYKSFNSLRKKHPKPYKLCLAETWNWFVCVFVGPCAILYWPHLPWWNCMWCGFNGCLPPPPWQTMAIWSTSNIWWSRSFLFQGTKIVPLPSREPIAPTLVRDTTTLLTRAQFETAMSDTGIVFALIRYPVDSKLPIPSTIHPILIEFPSTWRTS